MIDYAALKNRPFPDIVQTYTDKDSILYALGVGLGADPMDERQLSFVYEKSLKALPTMAAVLGYPGFWVKDPDTGIDWVRVLHGEQSIILHQPLPAAATVVGKLKIKAIVDKGKDRGALLLQERKVYEQTSGTLLATVESLTFARGDGGFSEREGNGPKGGDPAPAAPPKTPESEPQKTCDLPTLPQAALIYRLSGDYNPLHAEPAVATAAKFPRPILHGLATYGVAGHAILRTFCDYDPARLKSLSVRFSAPVYPGETIRTEMWKTGNRVQYRARVVERDIVVLSNGVAEVA
ncbi:MAG TPA: MaoC/PaaZ C-terminal domain-containing protein [Burkholderiales bacterium]